MKKIRRILYLAVFVESLGLAILGASVREPVFQAIGVMFAVALVLVGSHIEQEFHGLDLPHRLRDM